MDPKVLVALIAFASALITSVIATWVAYNKLKKERYLARRDELIKKQMDACEQLWQTLEVASFSPGDNRIIRVNEDEIKVDKKKAREFLENIISVFYSPVGIYLSRNVRKSIFELRDFASSEFICNESNDEFKNISKRKASRFRSKVTNLRMALREEIGVIDLNEINSINNEK